MRACLPSLFALSLLVAGAATSGEENQRITLPRAEIEGAMSVEEALKKRRSVREFRRGGLSLANVGQLLWAAQGVTHRRGYRTAPSAGALYPLEIYVVVGDVNPLDPGVYRYEPKRHELVHVAGGDRRKALSAAAADQAWVRRAPVVFVISGVYGRTAAKYGRRAERYTHIEVGHAAQNVYLQATALDLATVIVGAFRTAEVRELLAMPADHVPLGLMPIGRERR